MSFGVTTGPRGRRWGRRLLGMAAFAAGALLPGGAGAHGFLGWSPVASLHVATESCKDEPCLAHVAAPARARAFALSTDALHGIVVTGRVSVVCDNDSRYHFFLVTPVRMGVFQTVVNSCPDLSMHAIDLEITSATVREEDRRRGVNFTIYRSFE